MIELSLGWTALFWVINMAASVAGLFISVFLYISHDDMY